MDTSLAKSDPTTRWAKSKAHSIYWMSVIIIACSEFDWTAIFHQLSVIIKDAQLSCSSRAVHAWCLKTTLITNHYILSECGTKVNLKHFISIAMTPPTVNKVIIKAKVIKFLVSQTILGFSAMWAGSCFYKN